MVTTHSDWFNASDFVVLEAREYNSVKSNAKKHPFILLKHKGTSERFAITDRMVLFALLKRLDSDLTYSALMQTVYDAMGQRPPLDTIIQGYLMSRRGEPEDVIDIHYHWTDKSSDADYTYYYANINHIASTDSQSLYYRSTYDFISGNFLPHYEQLGEPKVKIDGIEVPYMRFINYERESGTIMINVLSHRNYTYVTGTVNLNGKKVQPKKMKILKGWTHLVEARILRSTLNEFEEELNDALSIFEEKIQNDYRWEGRQKLLGQSNRVLDFVNRNRLERENWELIELIL